MTLKKSNSNRYRNLVLLHSNDIHGDFFEEECGNTYTGGLDLLSGYINETRKSEKNTIYAIAVDMLQGSIIDNAYKGVSTMDLMNLFHPDVVTLGNHEIDYGITHLLFLERCAHFPIINANLHIRTTNNRLFKFHHTKKKSELFNPD